MHEFCIFVEMFPNWELRLSITRVRASQFSSNFVQESRDSPPLFRSPAEETGKPVAFVSLSSYCSRRYARAQSQ